MEGYLFDVNRRFMDMAKQNVRIIYYMIIKTRKNAIEMST